MLAVVCWLLAAGYWLI